MTTSDPRPGWLLDELRTVGRENVDADHVRHYGAKENAAAGQEVRLLQSRGLGERSTVVDMGAGTGQFALAVAPVCARVVAVDVSPVMLTVLRERLDTANVPKASRSLTFYQISAMLPSIVRDAWTVGPSRPRSSQRTW